MKANSIQAPLALALALVIAAGCGGDSRRDADFTGLSDDDRGALAGMSFIGPFLGAFMVWIAEADSVSGCPQKIVEGATVTYRGGCTTPAGDRYVGELSATNVSLDLFEPAPDPNAPSSFEFREFDLVQITSGNDPDQTDVFDGSISISRAQPEAGERYTMVYDYSLSSDGPLGTMGFDIDATLDCLDGACDYQAGSTGSLDSVGSFEIAGGWAFVESETGQRISGRLTLTGLQELVIDYDAEGPECVVFEVDGASAGTLCEDSEEESP